MNWKCTDCSWTGTNDELRLKTYPNGGDDTVCPKCGGGVEEMETKTNAVYVRIKEELKQGAGWDKFIALKEHYIRNKDFESAEGVRLAFADFGVEIYKNGEGNQCQ